MTLPRPAHVGQLAAQLRTEIFADTLTGKLEQPQIAEGLNRGSRAVAAQTCFQRLNHFIARRFRIHIDKVADDNSADITQAHLTRDLRCRLDVRLYDCIFEVLAAGKFAGIHVDDGKRLRRLDHDRPAGRQIDLRLHQFLQLLIDLVIFEERTPRIVIFDAIEILRAEQLQEAADLFIFFLVVDENAVDVGGDEVSRRLVYKVHIFVQQARGKEHVYTIQGCRATCE